MKLRFPYRWQIKELVNIIIRMEVNILYMQENKWVGKKKKIEYRVFEL